MIAECLRLDCGCVYYGTKKLAARAECAGKESRGYLVMLFVVLKKLATQPLQCRQVGPERIIPSLRVPLKQQGL
jgi:hypothetical protein